MDDILNAGNIPYVSEASVSVEIETEDMTLNIGPQHPSTHGVLRLVAKVDGEKISSVEPVLGYMHRGYEKLAEVRTYPQITTLVNRIDWVSGFANEIPFIAATEKLMEIEAPERAKHIRLILTEMARIASHFRQHKIVPSQYRERGVWCCVQQPQCPKHATMSIDKIQARLLLCQQTERMAKTMR